MSFVVTHRSGAERADPAGGWLDALLEELDIDDSEHPDVAVSHESGWTVSAFPNGLLVFENVEDPGVEPVRMTTDRASTRQVLQAVADGDLGFLDRQPWRE